MYLVGRNEGTFQCKTLKLIGIHDLSSSGTWRSVFISVLLLRNTNTFYCDDAGNESLGIHRYAMFFALKEWFTFWSLSRCGDVNFEKSLPSWLVGPVPQHSQTRLGSTRFAALCRQRAACSPVSLGPWHCEYRGDAYWDRSGENHLL